MSILRSIILAALSSITTTVDGQVLRIHPVEGVVESEAAEPSIAVTGDDGFIITWQVRLGDGETALRFRQIDAQGRAGEGGEIARGKGWFVNWADFPSLAVLDNGDWLAHWLQRSGAGYAYDIRMTRSRDKGSTWARPFTVHDDGTLSEHGFVAMVPAGSGDARIVWLDGRGMASAAGNGHEGHGHSHGAMTLRSARVSRDGVEDPAEVDDRVCDCCQTDAVRIGRHTLVVYRDRSDDEIRDVKFARHDGRGWLKTESVFDEGWRVAGCPVNGPSIAAQGDDVIVAAYSEAGGTPTVRVRTSTDGGRRWNDAVVLAEGTTQGRLDSAVLADGRFVVSRLDGDGVVAELKLSLHEATGVVTQTHALASLPSGRLIGFPRIAAIGDTVLAAWVQPEDGQPRIRIARIEVASSSERP